MEFLDRDVKKMPSLSYTEYLEGIQSYECEDCRASIKHKTDYLLDNNKVFELPQVYLLCSCSKGLWLPLVRGGIAATSDYLSQDVRWDLYNPSLSKYANNNKVYFTKCQKKEEDFFLQSYIKANIDPDQEMGDKLESLANDYYKLCYDTIGLNLKLGLLNVFLNHQLGYYYVSWKSRLENSIDDLVQYSSPIFWADYVSTYFDSCIVRIDRIMDKSSSNHTNKHTNSYQTYSDRYLEHYPKKENKSEICEIDPRLSEIRDRYIAHDDRRFNPEVLQEGLTILCGFYTNKVLKSINTLNEMQGIKIVFSYDPRKTLSHKGIARPILKIIDNELERYKEAGEYPRSEIV